MIRISLALLMMLPAFCFGQRDAEIKHYLDSLKEAKTAYNEKGEGVFQLGINTAMGLGFDWLSMTILSNGNTTKLSPGGGYGIGISSAYTFKKHFRLGLDGSFQLSPQYPYPENAPAYFRRNILSASFHYRIPVKRNEYVLVGAGTSYYFYPVLYEGFYNIVNGADNVFKYKPCLGWNLSASWEVFFGPLAMTAGLRYYPLTYHFKSGTSNGNPLPDNWPGLDRIRKLKGDGIDLSFSLLYPF